MFKKKVVLKRKALIEKQPFVSLEKGIYKSNQIKSLKLETDKRGRLKILGQGVYGTVYLGKILFQEGDKTSVKSVAIKRFEEHAGMTDKVAREYQKVIDGLREISLMPDKDYPNRSARAKLFPKAAMVKINLDGKPEWVMVSQAFYSKKKGSKLKHAFDYKTVLKITTNPEILDNYIKEFCWVRLKIAEKFGFAVDVVTALNKVNILAIDLDCITHGHNLTNRQKANDLVLSLNELPGDSLLIKRKAAKMFLSLDMSKELRKEFIKELIRTKILLEKDDYSW